MSVCDVYECVCGGMILCSYVTSWWAVMYGVDLPASAQVFSVPLILFEW